MGINQVAIENHDIIMDFLNSSTRQYLSLMDNLDRVLRNTDDTLKVFADIKIPTEEEKMFTKNILGDNASRGLEVISNIEKLLEEVGLFLRTHNANFSDKDLSDVQNFEYEIIHNTSNMLGPVKNTFMKIKNH